MSRRRRRRQSEEDWDGGINITYEELFEGRDVLYPVEEEFHPIIHSAIAEPQDVTVLPPKGEDTVPPIYLVRKGDKPQFAYALMDKRTISLDHHGKEWGDIMFAVVYKHLSKKVFKAPSENNVKLVAIKRLKKDIVKAYLEQGGAENPYKEIARMQELGDDIHVLSCIEALEDEKYLYIITPRGDPGTLQDIVFSGSAGDSLEPARVRLYWKQILEILVHLAKHDICHRDISPDNFLFLGPDRLVLFDFALSLRIPKTDNVRHLMMNTGNFGTKPCMAPEIYFERIYDGVGTDLYSAATILYIMLTKMVLYHEPNPNTDISFRYYVVAGGLSSSPLNERSVEVLMNTFPLGEEANEEQQHRLLRRSFAHLNIISTEAMETLENIIRVNPRDRWTLGQALGASFLESEE